MASSRSRKKAHGGAPAGAAFNMTVIAAAIAFLGVGVAYLIDGISRDQRTMPDLWDRGPTVRKLVAGRELSIPPAWFRSAEQRNEDADDRVELVFALPLGPHDSLREVGVTLLPRARARTSARLLEAVYLHQFLPEQIEGPEGLVGKPLKAEGGQAGETVWYDPASPEPFVAKCMAPVAPGAPETCLRTVAVADDITATYLFERDVLASWRRFDTEANEWLARIGGLEPG